MSKTERSRSPMGGCFVHEVDPAWCAFLDVRESGLGAVECSNDESLLARGGTAVATHCVVERCGSVEPARGRVREPVPKAREDVPDGHPGVPFATGVEVETEVASTHDVGEPHPPRVVDEDMRRPVCIVADDQREPLFVGERQDGESTCPSGSARDGRRVQRDDRGHQSHTISVEPSDDPEAGSGIARNVGEVAAYLLLVRRHGRRRAGPAQPARPEWLDDEPAAPAPAAPTPNFEAPSEREPSVRSVGKSSPKMAAHLSRLSCSSWAS